MSLFSRLSDKYLRVERDKLGGWSYWFGGKAFGNRQDFLRWSQSNPVLMTVIALRCKLYSQMEITAVNAKTGEAVDIPEMALINKPNYFQSRQDFFFQQMWFLSADGNCLTYQKRPFVSEVPKAMYNLSPDEINYKDCFKIKKFITTKADIDALEKRTLEYTMDGDKHEIMLRDLIPCYDLANGLRSGKLLRSPSRIEGLTEVLQNIEENLKSKNINLQMTQKYIASNKSDMNGTPQIQDKDRKDIEEKIHMKALHVTNANVEVMHLVKDLKNLALDPMFRQDCVTVLTAFDMNKEILNFNPESGSKYDNYEAGLVATIQNSIQPSADNTMNSFTNSWKLDEKGIKLVASFKHLPVMQTLVKTKLETFKILVDTLTAAVDGGLITQPEAMKQIDKTKLELGL